MKTSVLFVGVAACAVLSGQAMAREGTPFSISRTTGAGGGGLPGGSTGSNSTQGVWTDQQFRYSTTWDPPGRTPDSGAFEGGAGYATQNSSISDGAFGGEFFAKAWDGIQGLGGSGSSRMMLSFLLDAPQPVEISGSWLVHYNRGVIPTGYLQLSGPSGVVYLAGSSTSNPMIMAGTISFSGMLPAGTYTLDVQTSTSYSDSTGFYFPAKDSRVTFAMTVPAPGPGVGLGFVGMGLTARRRRA
ncbi:MAG TPA: hypothetical protein VG797_04985 [Phycisphaerales bacterium]|nr:hypothetical protein [Phycisphaerales bacterium]